MSSPTVDQLYNAGIAMNLAKGTAEHDARVDQFVTLFNSATLPIRLTVTVRMAVWRLRDRTAR